MSLRPSKLSLMGLTGLAILIGMPTQAQTPPKVAAEQLNFTKGIRLDTSQARLAPQGPNTEREGAEFRGLSPSALIIEERKIVLSDATIGAATAENLNPDNTNFESGRAILRPPALAALKALAGELVGKHGLSFVVVGHTDNQRISKRLRRTYPNNQALSEARSAAVADYLRQALNLPISAFTISGQGETQPLAGNDTPAGMAQNRRTVILVRYEVDGPVVPAKSVEAVVRQDDCAPAASPTGLPFSISVDGHPMAGDSVQTEADRQRCVDVALDRADIQIKYDPLNVAPALNVWAAPGVAAKGAPITWRTYTNYAFWQKSAEIRVFARGQSTSEKPVAVIPVAVGGDASWQSPMATAELGYVLRVYDAAHHFDETSLKTISLIETQDPPADRTKRDDLSGWGQSSLKLHNIPASGGSVTVSGERVKPTSTITALGVTVPVDAKGKFVIRQILPAGPHQVSVSVQDASGKVATYTRNLSIADKDWFYVAVADLTAAHGTTTGPAPIVTQDTRRGDKKNTLDGRMAFYVKGKILGRYLLTASADTKEQPLQDLFSNFDRKDPNYLLRRIDPNRYYPVYGDDSVSVDDAPTKGKFYVRLERDQSSVMWGNFQTSWTGTELTQYSRGLYGGDLVWNSQDSTTGGERRTTVEAFAAEPGTLQSREEFRGTGGSLYYLRRRNLTEGSERVWIEVRDRDSGLVLKRTLLAPSQDYDIDYLQGRVTLRAPLSSVADGSGLVQTESLSGDAQVLVTTYEYVPGLTSAQGNTVGVRASHWLTDQVRIGGTYYRQGDGGNNQELQGVDATFRFKPGTWIKGEFAHSKGAGDVALFSLTGGFDFSQNTNPNRQADAYRVDGALDLADLSPTLRGRISAYEQQRDAGFSGPGLTTPGGEALRQTGVTAVVPVGDHAEVALKVDDRTQISQSANSEELSVRVKLNAEWGLSTGVRHDDRRTGTETGGNINNASPSLSRNGARTDVILRLDYLPLKSGQPKAATAGGPSTSGPPSLALVSEVPLFSAPAPQSGAPGQVHVVSDPTVAAGIAATHMQGLEYRPYGLYAYAQQTLERSGNRADYNRGGVGGVWQVNSRVRLGGEVSDGTAGIAGKLSADYAVDERSSLYMTYARETEAPDQNYAGRQGVLTAGGRSKLNDQLGVFAESRLASGEGPHSLTHAFGVDFAPAKHWTTGLRLETGRLSDPISGDLQRDGISLNLGFKDDDLKAASTLEYRSDRGSSRGTVAGVCSNTTLTTASPCASLGGSNNRRTVLFKTTASYQYDEALRLIGSVNLSRSTSSQGAFYDGDYTEVVAGAAYRPVDNDRWNTLVKYTYFYDLPSTGQVDNVNNTLLDFNQRSHVFNVDTIYDLTPWLSLGAKFGLRIGELRAARNQGEWYSSQATLGVLRADLHFVREWDAVAELRNLQVREAHDSRSGVLLGLYRHVGDHAKIGIGYNFTDFSDDLTDLSYRSQGVFINALATF